MSEQKNGYGRIGYLVFNTADQQQAAGFWAEILGLPIGEESPPYLDLESPTGPAPTVSFQQTPVEHQGVMHPDIIAHDVEAATARALELGATLVRNMVENGYTWNVMRDPSGQLFCFVEN